VSHDGSVCRKKNARDAGFQITLAHCLKVSKDDMPGESNGGYSQTKRGLVVACRGKTESHTNVAQWIPRFVDELTSQR
jgi:hypothetical protein